jgi:glycerate dehydrogenase
MHIYFIVPSDENLPTKHMDAIRQDNQVTVFHHVGTLANLKELDQLKADTEPKIIAVDPAAFNWTGFDAETLADVPNVVGVCHSTTSFDWIKPQVLKGLGIKACNCPGFSSDSVAEYAVCMAMDTARRLPMTIKNGWESGFLDRGMLLKGKKAAVIGLGRIGTRMAEILQGIGMDVIYWSRSATDDRFTKVELDELFSQADVVMPALVENDETKQLITRERIDMMKPTAIMVGLNRIRDLWDEEYVIDKVNNNQLGGYAYEGDDHKPLETYKGNVWALPAIAWKTQDSLDNLMTIFAQNIIALAQGRAQNVVNG